MPLDSSSTLGGCGWGISLPVCPSAKGRSPEAPLHLSSLYEESSHHWFLQPCVVKKGCGLVDSSPANPAGEAGRLPWITMNPLSTARPSAHRAHSPTTIFIKKTLKPYKPGAFVCEPLEAAGRGR